MTKYRELIIKEAQKYYDKLNKIDFSHNFDHFLRVERLAKRIGKEEKADIQILEASALLIDIARILEDERKTHDHAIEGAKIAKKILNKINFPKEKIEQVCYAIEVHRKSKGIKAKTIEAKILQDADYLDALGAIDISRVIASSLQSKKYKRPIFVEIPFDGKNINSAIDYFLLKIVHPKLEPKNFNTKLGRKLAKERFNFMKEFTHRFIDEWFGKK